MTVATDVLDELTRTVLLVSVTFTDAVLPTGTVTELGETLMAKAALAYASVNSQAKTPSKYLLLWRNWLVVGQFMVPPFGLSRLGKLVTTKAVCRKGAKRLAEMLRLKAR
ncbi:MAG: hypothetical protein ABFE02_16075 [Sulfuricella sp.]